MKKILFIVIIVTGLSGVVYATTQQVLRQSANDPQIQIAEDVAVLMTNGMSPDFNAIGKVDIAKSLASFILIYDTQGKPIASTGLLNNAMPVVPVGVLEYAKKNGEHRVTWQPQNDVRIALVVVPYPNGFVAVGRSLREVEIRESDLLKITVAAWISILIASGSAMVVIKYFFI